MKRMKWSWEQLEATPMYVRRYCIDFLGAIAEREQAENDRAHGQAARGQRMG
ncbi:hypothetical protein K1Y80_02610 [Streptomyces sp. MAG02]|nr:hypothetical protein [Streptomyces sp. MAG02]